MKHGDFTGLAKNYAQYRPGYAPSVLKALLALTAPDPAAVIAADVGAGTGIWTRMLAQAGCGRVLAVEPNDDMRAEGRAATAGLGVEWSTGTGAATGLPAQSVDLLTMASSFHWVDADAGLTEFHRVVKPGGRIGLLWNPRLIEANPLLVEIEEMLRALSPDLTRVSSGRSGVAERLTDILAADRRYDDAVYLEARLESAQTPERYLGAWRSVNDVQVRLGPERFARFLDQVAERLQGMDVVHVVHLTRLWTARRR